MSWEKYRFVVSGDHIVALEGFRYINRGVDTKDVPYLSFHYSDGKSVILDYSSVVERDTLFDKIVNMLCQKS